MRAWVVFGLPQSSGVLAPDDERSAENVRAPEKFSKHLLLAQLAPLVLAIGQRLSVRARRIDCWTSNMLAFSRLDQQFFV